MGQEVDALISAEVHAVDVGVDCESETAGNEAKD